MGRLGDSYLSGGLFLRFSICDCKERILVAGWCTDLVRGTKTAKKGVEIGREVRNCETNMLKKSVKQTNEHNVMYSVCVICNKNR